MAISGTLCMSQHVVMLSQVGVLESNANVLAWIARIAWDSQYSAVCTVVLNRTDECPICTDYGHLCEP